MQKNPKKAKSTTKTISLKIVYESGSGTRRDYAMLALTDGTLKNTPIEVAANTCLG
jgi:hypothetical protein